jgi:hypothetical protein
MTGREASPAVAAAAGVLGALACILMSSPGDGQIRAAMVMRGAVVFLALAVAALLLVVIRPKVKLVWILAAMGSAAVLASVFGFFSKPEQSLSPTEALGPVAMLAAIVQVGAFAFAAFTHDDRADRDDRGDGAEGRRA